MDTVKHEIYEKVDKGLRTEWKLEKHIGCDTGVPQGFTLSYRNAKTDGWSILVDASQANGEIIIRAARLQEHGVNVAVQGWTKR